MYDKLFRYCRCVMRFGYFSSTYAAMLAPIAAARARSSHAHFISRTTMTAARHGRLIDERTGMLRFYGMGRQRGSLLMTHACH